MAVNTLAALVVAVFLLFFVFCVVFGAVFVLLVLIETGGWIAARVGRWLWTRRP